MNLPDLSLLVFLGIRVSCSDALFGSLQGPEKSSV